MVLYYILESCREWNFNVLTITIITKWQLCEVKNVLANLILTNILQYIVVSSHHILYLKLTQINISSTSQYSWRKQSWGTSGCLDWGHCQSATSLLLLCQNIHTYTTIMSYLIYVICSHICVLSYFSHMPDPVDPVDCSPPGFSVHGILQARTLEWEKKKNTGVDSQAPFQGIFPTQALNPGLLHCRQYFYHLSHPGKQPSNYTYVSTGIDIHI